LRELTPNARCIGVSYGTDVKFTLDTQGELLLISFKENEP